MERKLFDELLQSVVLIDQSCSSLLNGLEQGLVHVKNEYYDQALEVHGKKMTEETIIAWKMSEHMKNKGYNTFSERRYPNAIKRMNCDLIIDLGERQEIWVEVKLAWKAWFNCVSGPVYTNSCYKPYLHGTGKTHSFKHDLEKLGTAKLTDTTARLVCLIGFDHNANPIISEVKSVVDEQSRIGNVWKLVGDLHWADKRCPDFSFHCWCWHCQSHDVHCA